MVVVLKRQDPDERLIMDLEELKSYATEAFELEQGEWSPTVVESRQWMNSKLPPELVLNMIQRIEDADTIVTRLGELARDWKDSGNGHWRDIEKAVKGE